MYFYGNEFYLLYSHFWDLGGAKQYNNKINVQLDNCLIRAGDDTAT